MKAILKCSMAMGILFATSATLSAQSLLSVDPNNARQGESLGVGIYGQGTHFKQAGGMTVWFSQGSATIDASILYLANDTFMTAFFNIPGDAAIGLHDLHVYNDIDGTLTLYDGFRIISFTPPELVSIAPNSAQQGQMLRVAITGQDTHFAQASPTTVSVWFSQGSPTIYGYNLWALNDTLLLADVDIPSNAATGLRDLNVYNDIDGTITLYNSFTVTPYNPSLTSITPGSAYQGQSLSVRITGQNYNFSQNSPTIAWFSQGSSNIFSNNYIRLGTHSWLETGILIAQFDIPEDAPPGLWDVHVPNQTDRTLLTLEDGFMIARPGDLTCDGMVNFSDFAIIADNWLEGAGP